MPYRCKRQAQFQHRTRQPLHPPRSAIRTNPPHHRCNPPLKHVHQVDNDLHTATSQHGTRHGRQRLRCLARAVLWEQRHGIGRRCQEDRLQRWGGGGEGHHGLQRGGACLVQQRRVLLRGWVAWQVTGIAGN